ncbi:Crp/Fnr family transcriptional regulator [Kitasatospora sp. NPDC094011]|uniref:Crp/Fnr family transcriptional regulator n=1 Tax=Kitasatospora sp. NPDC094011 TaxID=3364090 RepID=UPI0037F2D09E
MTLRDSSSSEQRFGRRQKPWKHEPEALFETLRDRVGEKGWRDLLDGAGSRTVRAGERLLRQGADEDFVSLVKSGVLAIDIRRDERDECSRRHMVAFRSSGDVIGEIAVLSRGVRTASVTAYTDCEVAIVSGERFRSAELQGKYGAELHASTAVRQWEREALSHSGDKVAGLAWVLLPLLDHAQRRPGAGRGGIELRVRQRDLADCLGIGTKLLRRFTAGLPFGRMPEGRRERFLVTDPEGLREAAARFGGGARRPGEVIRRR